MNDLKFKTRWVLALFLIIALLLAGRSIYLDEQGNFHAITEGEAYRSAQLDKEDLEYYVKKYGIKSVINLRSEHPGDKWWKEEKETCKRLGVSYFNVGMSARKSPKPKRLEKLLTLFNEAPRPVLIHCRAGADRASLAAAIWKLVVNNEPKSEAKKQLSIIYSHIPIGSTRILLDDFFDKWEPLLSYKKLHNLSIDLNAQIQISLLGFKGLCNLFP